MNDWRLFKAIVVLAALTFISGCVPEDSLQWSKDGSVGLMRMQGSLYLVNGQNGELTRIEKDGVQPWPDISKDGIWIAYSREVNVPNLEQGLKLIGPGQAKIIEYYAAQMTKEILVKQHSDPNNAFPSLQHGLIFSDNWIARYICEKANKDVLKALPKKAVEMARAKPLACYQIVLVNRNNLADKRVVSTNLLITRGIKLAPNCKSIAYLMLTLDRKSESDNKFGEYSLYVTPLAGDAKVMLVDSRIAVGYSWREDSTAIAYWKANSKELSQNDPAFGELKEIAVADANSSLLAKPSTVNLQQGAIETHLCKGGYKQIAGSMFYPWMKVVYGPDGRIFFSSLKLSLPSGALDEGKWSLFCYDSVVGSITDVLPPSVSAYMGQPINSFELSNDGTRILLPMEKNRFAIFELAKSNPQIPVPESEGFGDKDVQTLAPSWKNGDISCLVDANSHFLKQSRKDKQEIIVVERDGKFKGVLSETWDPNILQH